MNLSTKIDIDLKEALKSRESLRLEVLRGLKSALKYAAIERPGAGGELNEADELQVIRKQIKQRQDSIDSYESAGRPELAEKERQEMALLAAYLPQPLSAQEVSTLVEKVISDLGATSKKDMGNVMKALQERAAGRVDGKTLSAEVQKRLP